MPKRVSNFQNKFIWHLGYKDNMLSFVKDVFLSGIIKDGKIIYYLTESFIIKSPQKFDFIHFQTVDATLSFVGTAALPFLKNYFSFKTNTPATLSPLRCWCVCSRMSLSLHPSYMKRNYCLPQENLL